MNKPFQSPRLCYRAVLPSDTTLIDNLSSDLTSLALSTSRLLVPPAHDRSKNLVTFLQSALLGVMITLKREGGNGTAIPIRILFLGRSKEGMGHHRNAELGIEVLGAHQGKGFGAEAIKWALNWGFQTAGLHRVGLTCLGWNAGAARLYAHLWFVLEEERREELWFDGRWWNMLLFGMVEDEWRAKYEVVELLEQRVDDQRDQNEIDGRDI